MGARSGAVFRAALIFAVAMLPYNGIMELLSAGASLGGSLTGVGRIDCWYPFLFSFLIACFAAGVFLFVAHKVSFDVVPLFKGYWPPVLCLLAAALFLAMFYGPVSFSLGFAVAAGALSAIAYILQVGTYRSILPPVCFKEVASYIGCCSAVATLVALLVISSSSTELIVCSYAISLIICALPSFAVARKVSLAPSDLSVTAASASNPALLDERPLSAWPVLAGASICMFAMFLALRTPDRSMELAFANVITSWTFVGFMLGAVCVAIASYVYPDSAKLRSLYISLCPLVVACPLVPCVLTVAPEGVLGIIFGLLTGFGYAYFAVVSLALFFEPGKKFISRRIAAAALVCLSVFGFVGGIAGMLLSSQAATMMTLSLFVVYLIAFALVPRGGAQSAPAQDASAANPLELRCKDLSDAWGLTEREREILSLLAYGRSQPAIAKELYVSTETVKVHVRHIYEKSGIHSREELLDLLQK